MNHPVNIAHRGARSLAPENTLLAGELGLAHGADIWEVDVAMSMDGIPYLLHDDTLARTTDVALRYPDRAPWQSGEFSWAELQQLDAGSWFLQQDPFKQIKVGKVDRALQRRIAGEALPTLRDALSFTRDANWWINVELKDLRGTIGDSTIVATAWRDSPRSSASMKTSTASASCAANTVLFSTLASWPAPRSPRWSTGSPNVSRTGRHRSSTAAGPPTITRSRPTAAMWPPPLTGASSTERCG